MNDWAGLPPDPLRILDVCARRAARRGLPPPAALVGDWLGAAAVIAPSVALEAVAPEDAFATGPLVVDHSGAGASGSDPSDPDPSDPDPSHPGPSHPCPVPADDDRSGYTLGFVSYPDDPDGGQRLLPRAVAGRAEGVLVLGHDGRWTARGTVPSPQELGLGPAGDGDPAHIHAGGAPSHGHVGRGGAVGDDDDDDDDELPPLDWEAPDRAAHRAAVAACLEAIRAGEIYQACLSTRLDGHLHGEPLALFSALWRRTRARKAALLQGPWGAVVSMSPETYLTRRGREVLSAPIKGTLPRHADPARLRASVKDVAENIMIVDLVRHDLGRTADLGSVVVPELLTVREAPGVWHLVSTVAARTGVPHAELVATTFPPASVTGTPKLRARELISGWEPRARGLHCGAIGITGPGDLDLSVAIRTLEIAADGRCEFGVGGGITIDSDPDAEWDECVHKAAFTWGGGPAPWQDPPAPATGTGSAPRP